MLKSDSFSVQRGLNRNDFGQNHELVGARPDLFRLLRRPEGRDIIVAQPLSYVLEVYPK